MNTATPRAAAPDTDTTVNTVTLCGRVSGAPVSKILPSGDEIIAVRLIVDRPRNLQRKSRQAVDTFDCVAWSAALRRKTARLSDGTIIEVTGRLRRRFSRNDGRPMSWVSVDLTGVQRRG